MSVQEEYDRLVALKQSGIYVAPAKLRALAEKLELKTDEGEELQRAQWETLCKAIHGLVNKVSAANIKQIVVQLFGVNLVRGRGVFVKCILEAQRASPAMAKVYCALVAVVNSKLPEVGEVLLERLVLQFRKAYKKKDKHLLQATVTMVAHAVNYRIGHEIVALQMLHFLLQRPDSDDNVEVSVTLMTECGALLADTSATASNVILERFRTVLQEGLVSKRVQHLIQVLFQDRRNSFEAHPTVLKELDLVEEDDQTTHLVGLDDNIESHSELNAFAVDHNYEENERKYMKFKREILGGDSEDEDDSEEESEEEIESEEEQGDDNDDQVKMEIKDLTAADLANFQKTVYLTIMSSMSHEEVVHKLLKLKPLDESNREHMLVDMVVKCCSQEKTYSKFYGLIGEFLARTGRKWDFAFRDTFKEYYSTAHRFENNALRNIANFWGHMFASDTVGWEALGCVKITDEDTTSAGRIFLKFMFERMRAELGLETMVKRINEPYVRPYIAGCFFPEHEDHLRYAINFFTAIKLGALTEGMREVLNSLPEPGEEGEEEEEEERGRTRSPSFSRSVSRSVSSSVAGSRDPSRSPSRSQSRSRSSSPRPQLPPHLRDQKDAFAEYNRTQEVPRKRRRY